MNTLYPACSVIFGPPGADDSARNEQEHAVYSYLESMRRNGQIVSDEIISLVAGKVTAYVSVAAPDAWHAGNSSRYVKSSLEEVVKAFGVEPEWCQLGSECPQPVDWKVSPWLYFESCSEAGLSLTDGPTGKSIPLYTVPMDAARMEELIFHARSMEHLDQLWFSGVLEMDVWREMVDPLSPTVQSGRALARELETAMERPVYYWLRRYYSFPPDIEQHRPCPGCGASWEFTPPPENDRIEFQCYHCRLVSERGNNDSDPPAEKIGYPTSFLPEE